MTKAKRLAAVAAIGGVCALSSNAQAAPMTHDGFQLDIQAGLGYLSSTAEYAGVEGQSASGMTMSGALLMGGTVGPVVIGGGIIVDNAFSAKVKQNGNDITPDGYGLLLLGFGAYADIFLDPKEGLHFPVFLGWGGLETTNNVGGSDPTGLVLSLGGGYNFWVSDEWSIGPLGRLTYAPLSQGDVSFGTWQFAALADIQFH